MNQNEKLMYAVRTVLTAEDQLQTAEKSAARARKTLDQAQRQLAKVMNGLGRDHLQYGPWRFHIAEGTQVSYEKFTGLVLDPYVSPEGTEA